MKKDEEYELDVMFCIPGRTYSGMFLESWTRVLMYCIERGLNFGISRGESPSLYHVRNLCLAGNCHKGENQPIFNGTKVKRIMWIDSDQVYTPKQFEMLWNAMDEDDSIDVITGHYMMAAQTGYAVWEKLDPDHYKVHGKYECTTVEKLEEKLKAQKLYPVEFSGLGWCLMKASCFDKLKYPWFRQGMHKVGKSVEITFEDFKFFQDMLKNKKKCVAHPACIVGHLKSLVI